MYAPERVVNVKSVNKTTKCTSISRTVRGVIVTLAGGAAIVAVIPHMNYVFHYYITFTFHIIEFLNSVWISFLDYFQILLKLPLPIEN